MGKITKIKNNWSFRNANQEAYLTGNSVHSIWFEYVLSCVIINTYILPAS
jgi:hypothetical protein